jgi:hypothetical protein
MEIIKRRQGRSTIDLIDNENKPAIQQNKHKKYRGIDENQLYQRTI